MSNETKHTQKQWRVGKLRRIEEPTLGGGCIVIVGELEISTGEQARLIAAAPELLEALRQALARMRIAHDHSPFKFTMEINNAVAALSKAQGQP